MGWSQSLPRTARKRHTCNFCHRIIDVGERYIRGAGFEGGRASSWARCVHCDALAGLYPEEVVDVDGGCWFDTFQEWSSAGGWGSWAEVRHVVGWRMRWRTRGGTQLPVPVRAAPQTAGSVNA